MVAAVIRANAANPVLPSPGIKPEQVVPRSFWQKAFLHVFPESGLHTAQKPLDSFKKTLIEQNNLSKNPHFYISKPVYYQAAAGPHKMITATLGMLRHAKRPDEVAFALAHEISHIQHGDIRDKLILAGASLALTITGMVLSAKYIKKGIQQHYQNKNLQRTPAQRKLEAKKDRRNAKWLNFARWMAVIGTGLIISRINGRLGMALSRRIEGRCDLDAIRYLQKAGFSTKGYKDFLQHEAGVWQRGRSKVEIARQAAQARRVGRSHPEKDARVAAMERYLTRHPDAPDARSFMSQGEWERFQRGIVPEFDKAERQLASDLLQAHNLDPKRMGVIVST